MYLMKYVLFESYFYFLEKEAPMRCGKFEFTPVKTLLLNEATFWGTGG